MMVWLRNRFGIPGAIAVLALVFAMLGGAYAASHQSDARKSSKQAKLSNKQIQEVIKIAKKFQGKGPQGPAGANGKDGSPGPAGAAGAAGPEGSPWTELGTLPSGQTEHGSWAAVVSGGAGLNSISFPIPLAQALDEEHVAFHGQGYNGEDEATEEHENCPGKASNPKARAGYLCVYSAIASNLGVEIFDSGVTGFPPTEEGASPSGAGLFMTETSSGGTFGFGTFAVTAP